MGQGPILPSALTLNRISAFCETVHIMPVQCTEVVQLCTEVVMYRTGPTPLLILRQQSWHGYLVDLNATWNNNNYTIHWTADAKCCDRQDRTNWRLCHMVSGYCQKRGALRENTYKSHDGIC